jgi:hypothetical protein
LKHNFILFFEFFENFPKIIALFKSKINVNSLFKFPPPPINLKKGKKKKKKEIKKNCACCSSTSLDAQKRNSKFSPCICGVQRGGAIILQRYPSTHVWLKKNEK